MTIKINAKQTVLGVLLALAGGAASAATVQLSVTNVPISPVGANSAVVSVNFVGDGATLGVGGRLNFDFTNFQLINVANGTATCGVNNANGRLAFNIGAATPLGNQTLCTFQVDHIGAAPISSPYTFSNMTYASGTGTEVNGNFVVTNGPAVGPTITYTPNTGTTITFPAATSIGGNTAQTITLVGAGGQNNGTTVLSACSSTVGNITFTDGADTCTAGGACVDGALDLQCVATNAAQNGTATCTETRQNEVTAGDGATVVTSRTWNVSCPAANVAPALAYNPATGNNVNSNQVGQGQTATGTIVVTPSAGSGTSTSTVSNCAISAASGATFTAPAGTLTFTGSTTATQNLQFTCVAPNAGAGNGTATLTCDQNIGGSVSQVTWPVTCLEGLPVAAPDVDYTPVGGTTITFAAGAAVGASVPGSTSVAVDINGGADGGGPTPETTSVSCSASAGFTVTGGSAGPVAAPAAVGTDTTVNVSCTSAATAQMGTLTCTASQSIDGGAPVTTDTTYPLDCAAALVNITSNPPEGNVTVAGTPATNVAGSINLSNSGSDSTLNCVASGSVTLGTVPASIPSGTTATVPFTCLTGAPGVNNPGTIQCTTDDPDAEAVLDYTVACLGVSDVPVPAINDFGKLLMVVLVIGLGLIGLGARRQ